MTSPLISVLSPSSAGPVPGGAAAAGNPFQAEGPSFSSVLGNQQAQRQAANTAPAPKPAQSNNNGSGTHAPSGAPAKSQQASSQQASQGSESQAAESSASGQADPPAAADAAQGEATQVAGSQAEEARTEEIRVAGDETASLHTLALAGAAALSASVDTRQANASSASPQASTLESTAKLTPAGQLTPADQAASWLAGQAGSREEAATRGATAAQANAAGRQTATETGSRTTGTGAAEATLTADVRTGTQASQAAANDAGIAIAAATTLAAGNTQNSQANSQATVLRRAEPLTPARAAILEGARRAVEAAQARAAQQETGSTQGTDTAEFLDMLAYARSRSQLVAAAAGAGSSGAEAASGTPAFMPAAPALAAAAPATAPVVATPLGSPYWGGEFGRQMVNMARTLENGSQVIELRLDPPDLGPIRISLSLSDNVAQAAFVSPHAVVRQTVENALPQLQQLLADAGISLGDTSVSDQNQPGQQAGEGSGNGHSAAGNGGPGTGESGGAALPAGSAAARAAGNPNALVDTFA